MLRSIVFALPRLDRLSITLESNRYGDRDIFAFSPRPGRIMPRLRTLCFTNISFHPQQEDAWVQCLRNSHTLRHLGLDGSLMTMNLLTWLTGRVSGLTSLMIRLRRRTSDQVQQLSERLDRFLSTVPCLIAFTGYNLSKKILRTVVVPRHGAHLQRLRFQGSPSYLQGWDDWLRDNCLLSSRDLRILALQLLNLRRLGIRFHFEWRSVRTFLCGRRR